MSAVKLDSEITNYMMGHTVDTYEDVQSLGIETLRNMYSSAGLAIRPKTQANRIDQTTKELERINPKLIVPSHCTGWRGIFAIAKALPEAFVWNSVGNLYQL